jgi:hypothetical protein
MASMSASSTNVHANWAEWPLHFNLGVDILASQNELNTLPHDWDPHAVEPRFHGGGHWPPADPAHLERVATSLDVSGF